MSSPAGGALLGAGAGAGCAYAGCCWSRGGGGGYPGWLRVARWRVEHRTLAAPGGRWEVSLLLVGLVLGRPPARLPA